MPRKTLFSPRHRPVFSGAHGGNVTHSLLDELIAHRIAWEIGLGVLAAVVIVLAMMALPASLPINRAARVPSAPYADRSYDAIEDLRAARLVSPPIADRSYDAVEDLRAARLVSPPIADRSYDAVEELRAARLVSPPIADRSYDAVEDLRAARLVSPPIADRSYDAIEDLRANRDLGD